MNLLDPQTLELLARRRQLEASARFDDYADSMAQERQRVDRVRADLVRNAEAIITSLAFDAQTQEQAQKKRGFRFDGLHMGSPYYLQFSCADRAHPAFGASHTVNVMEVLAAKVTKHSQQPPVPTDDARAAAPTSAPSRQPGR